ncbi:Outer membrane porin protein 32 precursor [Polaromonas sp. CG9_12]|nr:Outer membrane porin protein 32 precursor [Polaromonas sp. CG9_12]
MTLSGTIDMGLYRDYDKMNKIGQISRSDLTFSGVEDLGGGLAVTFKLKNRFSADTGIGVDTLADVGKKPFFHGESTVGLKGGFGSVQLGRRLDVLGNNDWGFDPWYNFDSVASPAWSFWHWNYATDRTSNNGNAEYGRLNNGIFYDSPSMGGFSVHYSGAFEKSTQAGAGTGNNNGLALKYGGGPIALMLASTKNSSGDTDTFAGAKYTVGNLELMGAYDKSKFKGTTSTSTAKVYTLGTSYTMGLMRFMASYGHLDTGAAVNPNANMIGLGAQYFLSKRTNVYASLGNKKFDGAGSLAAYGVGINHSF